MKEESTDAKPGADAESSADPHDGSRKTGPKDKAVNNAAGEPEVNKPLPVNWRAELDADFKRRSKRKWR